MTLFDSFLRWIGRERPKAPFPAEWSRLIDVRVPIARALPPEDRRELEELVQVFLEEKTFEGAQGLVVTDEMRVTIAAQACLLLLHRDHRVYPDLDTVLIYPSAYLVKTTRRDGSVVIEGDEARLGESWQRGLVVLAWDSVRGTSARTGTGHNVVLHEFAHQLDAEDGSVDGAPPLESRARYVAWARVLGDEYEDLVLRLHAGRPTDIDGYAATSPPEFFAVVTELFFDSPVALRRRHPELYDALAGFYRQDPASLVRDARGEP